jgi:hypothetical protein
MRSRTTSTFGRSVAIATSGRVSPFAPGTRWFHDNKDTALAKTALAINLEHVAAVRQIVARACGRA